jgi:hypothetical protein
MHCARRDALLAEYKKRVKLYAEAVASLRQIREYELQSEYKALWTVATNAPNACTSAQRQLGCHIVTHGCDMPAVDRSKVLSA